MAIREAHGMHYDVADDYADHRPARCPCHCVKCGQEWPCFTARDAHEPLELKRLADQKPTSK